MHIFYCTRVTSILFEPCLSFLWFIRHEHWRQYVPPPSTTRNEITQQHDIASSLLIHKSSSILSKIINQFHAYLCYFRCYCSALDQFQNSSVFSLVRLSRCQPGRRFASSSQSSQSLRVDALKLYTGNWDEDNCIDRCLVSCWVSRYYYYYFFFFAWLFMWGIWFWKWFCWLIGLKCLSCSGGADSECANNPQMAGSVQCLAADKICGILRVFYLRG